MKFVVLYRDIPEVIQYAEEHMREKFGNGASLIGWRYVAIVEKKNKSVPLRYAIAYLCKGSIFSFLWHKITLGRHTAVRYGWSDL